MARLPDGGVLVCDSGHNRIRLLGADGSVSVFAGTGRRGLVDGPASSATFDNPSGICVCADGSVLVADTGNHCIRAISLAPAGTTSGGAKRVVTTLAGCGKPGSTDGPASSAAFDQPSAVLALGSPGDLGDGESVVYVADTGNKTIRTIAATTVGRHSDQRVLNVSTLCGKPGVAGLADGTFSECLLAGPTSIAMLPDGTLAVCDSANNNIRRLAVDARVCSTLAGSDARAWGLVDGPSAEARFNTPKGLAISVSGDVWIADTQNHCVRLLREDTQMIATADAAWEAQQQAAMLTALPQASSRAAWENGGKKGGTRALTYHPTPRGAAGEHPRGVGSCGGDLSLVDITDASAGGGNGSSDGAFTAECQLFEREASKTRNDAGSGGWTYTGAASVTLKRAAHRTATLRVQVHGAASAEISVLRPNQMKLRDTAFVVCTPDPSASFTGFGVNELGLRFKTTTAAASFLAGCEAMVSGGAESGALPTGTEEEEVRRRRRRRQRRRP